MKCYCGCGASINLLFDDDCPLCGRHLQDYQLGQKVFEQWKADNMKASQAGGTMAKEVGGFPCRKQEGSLPCELGQTSTTDGFSCDTSGWNKDLNRVW